MSDEKPNAITIHRGRVYLSNARRHRIQVNDDTGGFRATFGTFGGGPGQFNAPGGLAVDQRGRLWVADTGNHRVVVLATQPMVENLMLGRHELLFLFAVGTYGSGDGEFDSPTGVAIDARGHIFVSDSGNHRIVILNADGSYRGASGAPGPPAYRRPTGVTVTNDSIYVVDEGTNEVKRFANPFRIATQC